MTHYIKGHLIFEREGIGGEDLNLAPIKSGGPASTRPDNVTIDGCFYKEFTSSNNQNCGDKQETHHLWR